MQLTSEFEVTICYNTQSLHKSLIYVDEKVANS